MKKSDQKYFAKFHLMPSQMKVVSLTANKQTFMLFMIKSRFDVIHDEESF